MLKRKTTWFVLVIAAIGGAYVRSARATPQNAGFMPKTATATFGELDINLHTIPADIWQAKRKTKGRPTACAVEYVAGGRQHRVAHASGAEPGRHHQRDRHDV